VRRLRLLPAALLLLLGPPALAQRFTAAIRGRVTDPSDAVVAGAKVALENQATGLARAVTTNAAGNFVFADLPVGTYRVEVTSAGFDPAVLTGIVVSVADVRECNVPLSAGRVTEVVTVESSAYAVKAAISKNIHLSSRVKLQLRFEVFNLFDTVNFLGSSLNTSYFAGNAVFDTGDPATATRIVSATPPGSFGQLTAARDPRTIQLGIRLTF
jgi:hypothetical protein